MAADVARIAAANRREGVLSSTVFTAAVVAAVVAWSGAGALPALGAVLGVWAAGIGLYWFEGRRRDRLVLEALRLEAADPLASAPLGPSVRRVTAALRLRDPGDGELLRLADRIDEAARLEAERAASLATLGPAAAVQLARTGERLAELVATGEELCAAADAAEHEAPVLRDLRRARDAAAARREIEALAG